MGALLQYHAPAKTSVIGGAMPRGDDLPECQHSQNGVCSRCVLRATFNLSPTSLSTPTHCEPPSFSSFSSPSSPNGKLPINKGDSFDGVVPSSLCAEELKYESIAELSRSDSATTSEPMELDLEMAAFRKKSGLLRLFESKLFNVRIALQYLSRPAETGVLSYLGNKMFQFPDDSVHFYLSQIIHLYIHVKEVASVLHPYIMKRCLESVEFALECAWLLEAFGVNRNNGGGNGHAAALLYAVLGSTPSPRRNSVALHTQVDGEPGMRRSESSISAFKVSNRDENGLLFRATFNAQNGWTKGGEETCEERLRAEKDFVQALMSIGNRLRGCYGREARTRMLAGDLSLLNLGLPARVWLPLYVHSQPHLVLRIAPHAGCVLNSKDKAPFCIYVEVQLVTDVQESPVPPRFSESDFPVLRHNDDGDSGVDVSLDVLKLDRTLNGNERSAVPRESETPLSLAIRTSKRLSSDSLHKEKTVSPADISKRLREWVKKPRKQLRHTPDDPSASAMSEPWDEKCSRIKRSSPYGYLDGWTLLPVIVKTGDDLRQELLANQLLTTLQNIWEEEMVPLYLRPYKIVVVSHDSGMIEPIINACSLHQIKKNQQALSMAALNESEVSNVEVSLRGHFLECFGPPNSEHYLIAQQNFVRSCAGYSLACYFLQVKDRHNGNILLDSEGHLIHIDFGYILSATPRNLGFETSPFKLTSELIDVMDGMDSDLFGYYRILLLKGLLAARKHHERLLNIVEIMFNGSTLPCFRGGQSTLRAMRDRFHLSCTETQLQRIVDELVETSRDSLTTRLYDNYQYYTNGIL